MHACMVIIHDEELDNYEAVFGIIAHLCPAVFPNFLIVRRRCAGAFVSCLPNADC